MDRRTNEDSHWALDKKIPIALIISMFFQVGIAGWWISGLNSRVEQLERGADKIQIHSVQNNDEMTTVKERILKLEINLTNINTKLDEIRDLIKRKN
jgi:hypothetical protein